MTMLFPETIQRLAAKVIETNRDKGRKITVAESCTGGLVSGALTAISGSSDVFDRGFITYSNSAKRDMLGVENDLIDTFGAVSVAVAWAMARGALTHSEAQLAVAVTGIAGPNGGSALKPVGTVVFARFEKGQSLDNITADQQQFDEGLSRSEIRLLAAEEALRLML